MSKAAACKVHIDVSNLARRFAPDRLRAKQEAFAERVAFEMRDYVPLDEGALQGSEDVGRSSDYSEGHVEWDAPYAQRVHDLPQSSIRKTKNPNARSHWPEEAKGERMDAWGQFAKSLMEER